MTAGPDDPTLQRGGPPVLRLRPRRPAAGRRPPLRPPLVPRRRASAGRAPGRRRGPASSHLAARAACRPVRRSERHAATLRERIVTDALLRGEADRDQNVYLGALFTRALTHAVPGRDLPAGRPWPRRPRRCAGRASAACRSRCAARPRPRWAARCPTTAGSRSTCRASTTIELDAADGVVRGRRRRAAAHDPPALAEHGLALAGLSVEPGRHARRLVRHRRHRHERLRARRARSTACGPPTCCCRRASTCASTTTAGSTCPTRAAAQDAGGRREPRRGSRRAATAARRSPTSPGSEGVFGLLLQLTVAVEPRPEIGAFLLRSRTRADALAAASLDRTRAPGARCRVPRT